MKNSTKIILLFWVVQVGNYSFADDSTCDTVCDTTQFSDSCSSSTEVTTTTSLNADDPAMLPVAMMFTTPELQESDNWANIVAALNSLSMIIAICIGSHYTLNEVPYSPSYYHTTFQSLEGYLLGYTLNDDDILLMLLLESWYDNVISKSFILDQSQQAFTIQSAAISATSSVASQTLSISDLSSEECLLVAQEKCLSDAIDCLNAEVSQKNQDLETARQNAFTAFSNADLFSRGRLGSIINESSISYQLVDNDGEILETIAASSSSSNIFALLDHANSQQGSMLKLVPYDGADEVVEDGTGEALSYGGTFTILCNTVGTNLEGNPYGYSQSVSVTRVYPSGATRAHVVDVSSLVGDSQYWEFNVTINPLPANTQFVYPRISTVSAVTEPLDVTVDFPTVLEATMDSSVEIVQSNSSSDSFPSFETEDYWSDVSA